MTFHLNNDVCGHCGHKLYLPGGGTDCTCSKENVPTPFFDGEPTEYHNGREFQNGLNELEAKVMKRVNDNDKEMVMMAIPMAGWVGFYRPRVMKNMIHICEQRGHNLRALITNRVNESLEEFEGTGMDIKLAQGIYLAKAQHNFYTTSTPSPHGHGWAGTVAGFLAHKTKFTVPTPEMINYLREFQEDMAFPEHFYIFPKVINPEELGHDPAVREFFEANRDAI